MLLDGASDNLIDRISRWDVRGGRWEAEGRESRGKSEVLKASEQLRSWEMDDHPLQHEEERRQVTGGTPQLTCEREQ